MAYIASQHQPLNKPLGIGAAVPTDARSYFYDAVNFIYRPFISTAEVLAYLDTPTKRTGHFPIIVNTGGTVNATTGVLTGGTNAEYVFKDGTGDVNLVIRQAAVTFANVSGAVTDNSTLTAYIAAELGKLVDASPGTLDTLNELAAALGDDPNFATTMTNALGQKVNISSIVNTLTSTATNVPLSAAQGKALKDLIDGLSNVYEPKIATKGTAFNKSFGTIAGTVLEGSTLNANNTWGGQNTFNSIVYAGGELEQVFQKKSATAPGVYFTTQPAANPTVTAISGGNRYAETAAVVHNNGSNVAIPAKNVDVLNAATGKKRIDVIVARYSGGTAGYELVPGAEVDSSGTAVEPALPAGTIKVRQVSVGASAQATSTTTDVTALENRVTAIETVAPPAPVAGQEGFVQTLDATLKRVWAAAVATGGGVLGSLQWRGSDGKVTGTDILTYIGGILKLGKTGTSGKFEIVSSESVLEAQDGHTMQFLVNTNLESAWEMRDKVTGKLFMKVRTKTGDEAIVVVESSDVDALIGAPFKTRQGKAVTTNATKTYFKQPNTETDIKITMPFDGSAIIMKTHILGATIDGTEAVHIEMQNTYRKANGVVYQVGTPTITVKETVAQGATAGAEVTGDNSGINLYVVAASSAMTKTFTWVYYNQYMKL